MVRISTVITAAAFLGGCTQLIGANNEFVFLGESNVAGEEAAQEANLIVRNANAAGCRGVSVGGYATSGRFERGGQVVYGVPVMVSCPSGVVLLPNGSVQP